MFNIGFSELIVVLIIALLFVGPKDLPKVARWLAQKVRFVRSLIAQAQEESGWNRLLYDVEDTKREVEQSVRSANISEEVHKTASELKHSAHKAAADVRSVKNKLTHRISDP